MKSIFALASSLLLVSMLFVAFAFWVPATASAQAKLDGKAIFLAQKCNLCHTISSVGITATVKSEKMQGPDLAGLVAKLDAKLVAEFLRQKTTIEGKKHKKAFTGSDEELGALIAWLQTQKKKE